MKYIGIILFGFGLIIITISCIHSYNFWNENIGGISRKILYDNYYSLADIEFFKEAKFTFAPFPSANEMNKVWNEIYLNYSKLK